MTSSTASSGRRSIQTCDSPRHGASVKRSGVSPDEIQVNEDFHDLLAALSEVGARFLIVGAYAVSFHAEPRATGDLDVWVEPTSENARRVLSALRAFGAPLHDLSETDLASPDVVFQIGLPPRRIDILTSITGVAFDEAWDGRAEVTYGDVRCPIIGREALIKNKIALGRPRDKLDVELLRRARAVE